MDTLNTIVWCLVGALAAAIGLWIYVAYVKVRPQRDTMYRSRRSPPK